MAGTHAGPYTIEDYYALPHDGQRYELLDGSLIVSPFPAGPHQRVTLELVRALDRSCPTELEVIQMAVRIRTAF